VQHSLTLSPTHLKHYHYHRTLTPPGLLSATSRCALMAYRCASKLSNGSFSWSKCVNVLHPNRYQHRKRVCFWTSYRRPIQNRLFAICKIIPRNCNNNTKNICYYFYRLYKTLKLPTVDKNENRLLVLCRNGAERAIY